MSIWIGKSIQDYFIKGIFINFQAVFEKIGLYGKN
jgi:hypothetical protein